MKQLLVQLWFPVAAWDAGVSWWQHSGKSKKSGCGAAVMSWFSQSVIMFTYPVTQAVPEWICPSKRQVVPDELYAGSPWDVGMSCRAAGPGGPVFLVTPALPRWRWSSRRFVASSRRLRSSLLSRKIWLAQNGDDGNGHGQGRALSSARKAIILSHRARIPWRLPSPMGEHAPTVGT